VGHKGPIVCLYIFSFMSSDSSKFSQSKRPPESALRVIIIRHIIDTVIQLCGPTTKRHHKQESKNY